MNPQEATIAGLIVSAVSFLFCVAMAGRAGAKSEFGWGAMFIAFAIAHAAMLVAFIERLK